ncbi:EthD family reductase [Flavobacterium sp.]|uniref:EthD family reductase n=1 Tax=Flavobacterium sp. TaxID=239 RepID=UPI003D12F60F
MIKVTVFYPVKKTDWFDISYYLEKHMPLSKSLFGEVLKGIAIEENMTDSAAADQNGMYKIIGHLFFESMEDFYDKFLANKEILYQDALNYTNVIPVLQISKVLVCQTPWI